MSPIAKAGIAVAVVVLFIVIFVGASWKAIRNHKNKQTIARIVEAGEEEGACGLHGKAELYAGPSSPSEKSLKPHGAMATTPISSMGSPMSMHAELAGNAGEEAEWARRRGAAEMASPILGEKSRVPRAWEMACYPSSLRVELEAKRKSAGMRYELP